LVQTGDEITLDVPGRTLTLEASEEELLHRRPNAATLAGFAKPVRGWERLYIDPTYNRPTQAPTSTSLSAAPQEIG
jgi:dihydroxyacid dehydratase/phosphogluconate dehydratase